MPLLLLTAACGAGSDSRTGYTIVDSTGIRITTVQLALEQLPEWMLAEEPAVVLDGAGAGGGPFFERVTSAAWTSAGGIVVLDRQADQLHLFAADGSYVRSFGRSGDGPGEFANIASVTVTPGDSIFVFDRGHDRVSVFHAGAGFARDLSLLADSAGLFPNDVWALAPDRFLLLKLWYDQARVELDDRPFLLRSETRLTVHDGSGARRAGPLAVPGPWSAMYSFGSGPVPLAARTFVDAGPAGVVYGTGDEYAVTLLDSGLRVVAMLRWPSLREPTVDADREEVRASIRETFGEVRPQWIDEILTLVLSDDAVPELRPAHGELVLGTDGSVWV
ncbi:MAG: 6-bladed beta-propeller, partial [Longimicrobiales bacterium]